MSRSAMPSAGHIGKSSLPLHVTFSRTNHPEVCMHVCMYVGMCVCMHVIHMYIFIHTDLLITAVIEIPLARTCGCLSLCVCVCVCVCVCICVHNLTSVSGDVIPGQFSAGRIRPPVGNYSLESSTGHPAGEANALSLIRCRWSLIDNQIFFSHALFLFFRRNF